MTVKPRYDVRRSFNKLLETLEKKSILWSNVGHITPKGDIIATATIGWTKQDTRDVINAGIERSYKPRRLKP